MKLRMKIGTMPATYVRSQIRKPPRVGQLVKVYPISDADRYMFQGERPLEVVVDRVDGKGEDALHFATKR